jgi:hypothetical protein
MAGSVLANLIAAGLWGWAASIDVPDNQDTFITALQEIGRASQWAAGATGVAAICAAVAFASQRIPRRRH